MRELIIGFSRPKKFNLFSFIARLYQGMAPYSHAYMVIKSESLSRLIVYEASHGEVHFESMGNWLPKNIVTHEFKFMVTPERYVQLMQFCIDHANRPYSILAILAMPFTKKVDGKKAFICSELVARAIGMNGNLDTITPREILKYLEGNGGPFAVDITVTGD